MPALYVMLYALTSHRSVLPLNYIPFLYFISQILSEDEVIVVSVPVDVRSFQ